MRTSSSLIRLSAILGLLTLAAPVTWGACPTVGPGPSYTLSIPPPYTNANWSGCNLTNANMSGFDFSLANLSFANLTNANLSGSILYSYLNNANFTGANLANATLSGGLANDSNFTNASLAGANVSSTGVQRSDFTGANLTNATFASSYMDGVILLAANLTGLRSGGVVGVPVQLPPGWRLTSGYFFGPQADLTGANLTGFNLAGMNLAGATLNSANLTNANLTRADLSRADIHTANLAGTVLLRAVLASADLTGSTGAPASYTNAAFLNTTCADGSTVTSPNTCWSSVPSVSCTLDVDGNGTQDALTDGLIILRALFGLTGSTVTNGAIGGNNATRSDWTAIRTYLNTNCGGSFAQ